jgi:hypothetical protein
MQLVAYGAQDIYLTGNPQITFFKVVYRRHTNFSIETIKQTFNGPVSANSLVSSTISRNGDLLYKMYITSSEEGITNGSAIVSQAEIEIGGQLIDRHYAEWMQVWNELTTPETKALPLKDIQGDILSDTGHNDISSGVNTIHVPLLFWFCRNPGLSLPLISLQYHEINVKITLGDTNTGAAGAKLWTDYIYLDTDERRRFAKTSHEYLIEQLQKNTYTSGGGNKDLKFNHPVKELIWINNTRHEISNLEYQLIFNGHDRFYKQNQEYFKLRQPLDHHTAVPRQNLSRQAQFRSSNTKNISVNINPDLLSFEVTEDTGLDGEGDITGADIRPVLVPDNGGNTLKPSADTDVASGNDAPTSHLLILGSVISGCLRNSIRLNDIHKIYFVDGSAPLNNSTTFAKVIGISKANLDLTVPNDGTGPAGSGTDIVGLTSGVGGLKAGSGGLVISYDKIVFNARDTIENGDRISIEIIDDEGCRTSKLNKNINVYSFALKPEEHQPSGTCNFSRIDDAKLNISVDDGGGNIYALNYNVLRIMSGMGGLAYSN